MFWPEDFGKLPKTTGSPRRIRPVADWQPMLPRVEATLDDGWLARIRKPLTIGGWREGGFVVSRSGD